MASCSITPHTAKQLLLEKKSFWGGLEGQILTNSLADLLNVPNNQNGYLIKSVAKGSRTPGASVANMVKIKDAASVAKSGTPLKITILRAGRVVELTVKVP